MLARYALVLQNPICISIRNQWQKAVAKLRSGVVSRGDVGATVSSLHVGLFTRAGFRTLAPALAPLVLFVCNASTNRRT